MFDWLFGSGRQAGYEDTQEMARQTSKAQADATAFYYDNFADGKFDQLDEGSRANLLSQYQGLDNTAKGASAQYGDTLNLFNQEEKDNRYNYFGNGLLGSLLNPIGQTASAVKDLATGQYGQNNRDVTSDIGAAAGTALSFLPFVGGIAKGAGALGAVGKAANSIPGMAATGAGFGAAEAYRQGGADTDLQTALGAAGTGAAFGAGIPIAGKIGSKILKNRGSKVLGKELNRSGADPEAARQYIGAVPNKALYQTALKSYIPRSTIGKVAAGGGALLGANALMGGGGQPVQAQPQLTDYEIQMLTAMGY